MISKPAWLHNFLLSLHWKILIWYIDVGGPIETAIDWVLGGVNTAIILAQSLGAKLEGVRQWALDLYNQLKTSVNQVWSYVTNIASTLGSTITTWWSGMQATVLSWVDMAKKYALSLVNDLRGLLNRVDISLSNFFASILPFLTTKLDVTDLIKSALAPFRSTLNTIETFKNDIVSFFGDPPGWLASHIEDWFWGKEVK